MLFIVVYVSVSVSVQFYGKNGMRHFSLHYSVMCLEVSLVTLFVKKL